MCGQAYQAESNLDEGSGKASLKMHLQAEASRGQRVRGKRLARKEGIASPRETLFECDLLGKEKCRGRVQKDVHLFSVDSVRNLGVRVNRVEQTWVP